MIKQGRMPAGQSLEYYCKRLHLAYGHPDEVAAYLSADRVLPYSADLILQFDPVLPSLDRAIHMLEQIATQVAPRLGWRPLFLVPKLPFGNGLARQTPFARGKTEFGHEAAGRHSHVCSPALFLLSYPFGRKSSEVSKNFGTLADQPYILNSSFFIFNC
jgi:hypothetical protein